MNYPKEYINIKYNKYKIWNVFIYINTWIVPSSSEKWISGCALRIAIKKSNATGIVLFSVNVRDMLIDKDMIK